MASLTLFTKDCHWRSLFIIGVIWSFTSNAEDTTKAIIPAETVEFFEGESFRLPCSESNDVSPEPPVIWHVNDQELTGTEAANDASPADSSIDVKEDGSLAISNASADRTGRYTCLTNQSIVMAEYHVIIIGKKASGDRRPDSSQDGATGNVMTDAENLEKPTSDLDTVQAQHLQLKQHVLSRLEGVESATGRANLALTAQVRDLEAKMAALQQRVDKMSSKMADRLDLMLADEAKRVEEDVAQLRFQEGRFAAEYTWIVANFTASFNKSLRESVVLQSDSFYSHKPGYRMHLLLYPNYKKSNFTGLFVGLEPGEYDELVPWPFRHDFRLDIVSHRPNVFNDAATVRLSLSNCGEAAFRRPKTAYGNPRCGFREFISHEKLRRRLGAFVINDSVVVRITIMIGQ